MMCPVKIRQYFTRAIFFFLFVLVAGTAFSQIESKEEKAPEKKEEKKKKESNNVFNEDSLSGTNVYFEGMGMWTYRTFSDETVYGSLSEREKETGTIRGGMRLGLIRPLNDYVSLDIGISYFGYGEKYSYRDTAKIDSTYSYKRRYLQFGIPLRIRVTSGDKFQGFMYAGITPVNILQIRYDSEYTTEFGEFIDLEEEKIKNDFSSFNVMLGVGAGVRYNFRYFGITYSAEYRRHLLNTYDKNELPVSHHMYGIGMSLGMYLRF